MSKSIIAKSVTVAALIAVLVAGATVVFTPAVPQAMADTVAADTLHKPTAKGDRLPSLASGAACSSRGWPYYEQICQFDLRRTADSARMVRVVAIR